MASGETIRRARRSDRLSTRLAALLVEARGERPRAALAADAGVAASTLAAVERGTANPTLAYLDQLGDLYDVEFDLVARPKC